MSSRANLTLVWDFTDGLAAYASEHGEDAIYAIISQFVTGTATVRFLEGLGSTFTFQGVSDDGLAKVYATFTCSVPAWSTLTILSNTEDEDEQWYGYELSAGDSIVGDECGFADQTRDATVGDVRVDGTHTHSTGDYGPGVVTNNRCQYDPGNDLTVSGTISPAAGGGYDLAGTYNGYDYWEREDSAYYLYWYRDWWQLSDTLVLEADSIPEAAVVWYYPTPMWPPDPGTHIATYSALQNATGDAVVAEGAASCVEVETDQCA